MSMKQSLENGLMANFALYLSNERNVLWPQERRWPLPATPARGDGGGRRGGEAVALRDTVAAGEITTLIGTVLQETQFLLIKGVER